MKEYKKTAQVFKALADETRLAIVDLLRDGELCACNILDHFAFTQPTLSYHMKILTDCGLVEARRDGAWMKYTLNTDQFEAARDFFEGYCTESVGASKKESCAC